MLDKLFANVFDKINQSITNVYYRIIKVLGWKSTFVLYMMVLLSSVFALAVLMLDQPVFLLALVTLIGSHMVIYKSILQAEARLREDNINKEYEELF